MMPRIFSPDRRCLPVSEWPEADGAAWQRLTKPAGPLDDPGAGADWRAETREARATAYGRWLGFVDGHFPHLLSEPPADRLTPATVAAYVAFLQQQSLAPYTVLSYLIGLRVVVAGMDPHFDRHWLDDLIRRLQHTARPATSRTDRLQPAADLWALGLRLMDEAETRQPRLKLDQHTWFRDGLMIALLAARPLRLKNFAAIELGRHLVRRGEHYELRLSAEETKTHKPIAVDVPEALTESLDHYLGHHRPALFQGQQHAALWISNQSRPMPPVSIRDRIKAVTRKAFGTAINPHAFRHCAATSIAIEDPEHVHIVAPVLQHGSLLTGERHYNLAHSVTACRRHQTTIAALRKQAKQAERGVRS